MNTARQYDLIIFGATGFTGQYVAEEVAQIAGDERITWAVAGRSIEKLRKVLANVKEATGKSVDDVGLIIADIEDPDSLSEMAKKGKVVLNCVGPYRFYGEVVVKACIDNGASHIDISGEPQFLERMQLEYNRAARDKNVYVIGACGYDSIPSEMGTIFLEKHFDGQLNSVETFLNVQPRGFRGHFGTWQSAIHAFASVNELRPLRRKLFPEKLPEFRPKLKLRGIVHKNPTVNSWCLPMLLSDETVVMRSQRHFYETERKRPIQMNNYIQVPSLSSAILTLLAAALFGILASFKAGRNLLEKHPKTLSFGYFDHDGPTKEGIKRTSFTLTLMGRGWREKLAEPTDSGVGLPSKEVVARVSGPEPGYIATPIFMVQSALALLRDSEKLPPGGGVLPPGAAFAKTSLIDRLKKRGITFEIRD